MKLFEKFKNTRLHIFNCNRSLKKICIFLWQKKVIFVTCHLTSITSFEIKSSLIMPCLVEITKSNLPKHPYYPIEFITIRRILFLEKLKPEPTRKNAYIDSRINTHINFCLNEKKSEQKQTANPKEKVIKLVRGKKKKKQRKFVKNRSRKRVVESIEM